MFDPSEHFLGGEVVRHFPPSNAGLQLAGVEEHTWGSRATKNSWKDGAEGEAELKLGDLEACAAN
jgi:hypothetical protein